MAPNMFTVLELLGYVLLYVILCACLSRPLRRPKMAHFLAAGITGIVFIVMTVFPEEDTQVMLHYMPLVLAMILLLFVVLPSGWLVLRVLRSNHSFLQRIAAALLIAAAVSLLIWVILQFAIFGAFFGGDPYLGKVIGDDYYFGQHGRYTRVTPETWWISFWLLTVLHCLPPLCLVSGLILTWLSRLRERTKFRKAGAPTPTLAPWARFDRILAWLGDVKRGRGR